MPTDPQTPAQQAESARLDRMEHSIEEINTRIARLAIALGVSLDNEADVQRVLSGAHQGQPAVERRASRQGSGHGWGGAERRTAHSWTELRGLMVLRYGVEKNFVDQVGAPATRKILIEAEQQMSRDGFKPGADGTDLQDLISRG